MATSRLRSSASRSAVAKSISSTPSAVCAGTSEKHPRASSATTAVQSFRRQRSRLTRMRTASLREDGHGLTAAQVADGAGDDALPAAEPPRDLDPLPVLQADLE